MKKIIKVICLILCLCLLTCAVGCDKQAPTDDDEWTGFFKVERVIV